MLEFKFPDIGEGISEGRLLKWLVKAGDKVKEGDSLFLVETDKVNAEIPSPGYGVITELLAKAGDIIYVGDIIVKISNEETTMVRPISEKEENAGVVGAIEVSSEVIESSDESYKNGTVLKKKVLATPVARKLAKDLGIDINIIKGSGLIGRVMKEDIYRLSEENKIKDKEQILEAKMVGKSKEPQSQTTEIPALKIEGDLERVPLTMLRKTIAKNMVLSKSVIPHAVVMDEFDVTKLVEFRNEVRLLAEEKGIHLTYMSFIIKAVTLSLKEFPVFNSSYDVAKEEIILKKFYNIGIAVDTSEGLLVPVIKDADRKGILYIARELQKLGEDARNRNLTLEKLQNGTFTITNYGATGSSSGIPVIRYPEAAILGIGKIGKKPVINENEEMVIRSIMNISLCIDHRIIDGGDAGRFLKCLREYLENPMLLMIS